MGQREELIDTIRWRLARMAASKDPAIILAPTASMEAQRLLQHTTHDGVDTEAFHAIGWLYYERSRFLPPAHAAPERDAAVACFSTCFLSDAEDLPKPLLPVLAQRALPVAGDVLTHAANPAADRAELTFVVSLYERIADSLPEDDPDHVQALIGLGVALTTRYQRTGRLVDARQAVEAGRSAVRITGERHPSRRAGLMVLAEALLELSAHTDDPHDLDEAVEAGRATLGCIAANDPARAAVLANLGLALKNRFRRTGRLSDLDEAVRVGRIAVRDFARDDPNRAVGLSTLGLALQTRFRRTKQVADLDEAVEMCRAAVQAAPHTPALLTSLSLALKTRCEHNGTGSGLDEAAAVSRAALDATPQDAPEYGVRLVGLGNILRLRSEFSGRLEDLDEAVDTSRAGVQAMSRDAPDYATNLSNFGSILCERFRHLGDLSDIDEAADACRAAVDAVPPDHPGRADTLYELSRVLRMRFERTKSRPDVDEAVAVARASVEATPDDDPDRARHLSILGNALLIRFRHSRELADADEAVDVFRTVVRTIPPTDANRGTRLTSLGTVLLLRYEHTGDLGDLDEGVVVCRAALQAVPDGHPDHCTCLYNLGNALKTRFTSAGNPEDGEEAITMHERALDVTSAPPLIRILAACAAGRLAASSDPRRAAWLFERAVQMLPQVTPRRLRRGDQEHALGTHSGLAADATALALAGGEGDERDRAVRALRLAESARAVILAQSLDVRGDLTDLHDRHPQLAERFSALRELLDQDSAPSDRRQLATEFEDVLKLIRSCEGFGSFGLPPTVDDLLAEAAEGPVVTFNISDHRSDALLLTRHGISSCPLPELTEEVVVDRINTFYRALADATSPTGDRVGAQRTLHRILEWLWDSAAAPALDALTALGAITRNQDGHPPRVWWAPGGLLGLLPLHAAGFHNEPGNGPRRTVMDRVISSYTPTIRALRHSRRRRPAPDDRLQSLIVAMPTTPGQSPLPHVPEEVRRVRELLPEPVELTESNSTAAAVLTLLPQRAIAHFACHGARNATDPSQSRLLLHDHATAPLTVSSLAHINLEKAQLAYLSACSTANAGGFGLRDEVVHLASAFQLAGFPHVIGTLWPIDDHLAVDVAETFYTHLATGRSAALIPGTAATALHHTVRAMRDRFPATPSLWAGYLHAGA